MSELTRFGVSLDNKLLNKFDKHIESKNYKSRSKAIVDLISKELLDEEKITAKEIVATITIVFDHHKRDLSNRLTEIQHNFHSLIISSQHIHLNHSDCLEIIILKGSPQKTKELTNQLTATKGVKYTSLNIATATTK